MGAAEALFVEELSDKNEETKEKGRKERKNSAAKRLAARRSIESYQEEKALNRDLEEFWFDQM